MSCAKIGEGRDLVGKLGTGWRAPGRSATLEAGRIDLSRNSARHPALARVWNLQTAPHREAGKEIRKWQRSKLPQVNAARGYPSGKIQRPISGAAARD